MILISHRGNIDGRKAAEENKPEYIDIALSDYYVEIDVWYIDNTLYLGHDSPVYTVSKEYLTKRKEKLFIHCKNVDALIALHGDFHCFFHEGEDAVLTSRNLIIAHVDCGILKSSVVMMPEVNNYDKEDLEGCVGICSDVIDNYR